MSHYLATIEWRLAGGDFLQGQYSRLHEWHFDNGTIVHATASPHIVPAPWTDGTLVDPEEAFVAALSSCHMLFFLSIAAKKGLVIEYYKDQACGILADRGDGKLAMTRVELRPAVVVADNNSVAPDLLASLHHLAHEKCFIANSVNTDISIIPV